MQQPKKELVHSKEKKELVLLKENTEGIMRLWVSPPREGFHNTIKNLHSRRGVKGVLRTGGKAVFWLDRSFELKVGLFRSKREQCFY
jgi:hypothetical protein